MQRVRPFLAAVALLLGGPAALSAQEPQPEPVTPPIVDSIVVEGNARLTPSQIIGTAGLVVRQPVNYRDIQRAITNLFRTGQFDDVVVEQRTAGDKLVLALKVKERPVLEHWAVRMFESSLLCSVPINKPFGESPNPPSSGGRLLICSV
jgi:outer membrane protein assembly factor BamA